MAGKRLMKMGVTSRIVLLFLLLGAALAATIGVLSYRSGSESLKAAAIAEMLAMGEEKEAAVDMWIEERLDDMRQIASQPDVVGKAERVVAAVPGTEEARAAHEILMQELEPHIATAGFNYVEVFVLEPEGGKVIASTCPAEEGKAKLGRAYFEKGKTDLSLQGPYYSEDAKAAVFTAAVPLRAPDGRVSAVLAARLNLEIIGAIARRRTGLHETEDSYLINAERFLVTQPRFISEPAVLSRKLDTEAARRCAARSNAVTFAPDYRGVPAISIYRWNPKRNLGLIVEIAQADALAPARSFRRSLILISSLALLGSAGLAWMLARTITRPLLALVDRVRQFGEGHPGERPQSSGDEITLLTREFDRMAVRVIERTAELAKTNETLTVEITERKRTQADLEKFIALIENSGDFVGMANLDGKPFYVNEEGRKMVGLDQDAQIASIPLSDYHDSETAALLEHTAIPSIFALGQWASEGRLRHFKTGALIPVHIHTFLVRNRETHEPICLATVQRDITKMKEDEEKMEKTQKELINVSRQAGMAEVATTVLHNVGNVLNSVNVSATLAGERIRKMGFNDVARIAAILQEHAGDLPAFFASDPRGAQIPVFLQRLGDHFRSEEKALLAEIDSLVTNIDHIKEVVVMQQSYARVAGVVEELPPAQMVEDALRLNAGSMERHEVTVVREFADVPPIAVEKHKVIQVLVNLIRNAKYACDDGGRADKRVWLRIARNGGDFVKIAVADNGVGIPAENLARIFEHGFTTRRDGHGFGLHSGALAARELGGSLRAESDGPGRGATFTLELPLNPKESIS